MRIQFYIIAWECRFDYKEESPTFELYYQKYD